jgi:hypothetical protein
MSSLSDQNRTLAHLSHMAAVYCKFGQFAASENLYHVIVDDLVKAGLMNDQRLALAMYSLAELLSAQNRNIEALPFYKGAVGIWEQTHPLETMSVLWYSDAHSKMQRLIDATILPA